MAAGFCHRDLPGQMAPVGLLAVIPSISLIGFGAAHENASLQAASNTVSKKLP
jgi:hypothetical protein